MSDPQVRTTARVDAVLVGTGIMSATLGALLRRLEPDWSITVVERLDAAGVLEFQRMSQDVVGRDQRLGHRWIVISAVPPNSFDEVVDVGREQLVDFFSRDPGGAENVRSSAYRV